MGTSFLNSKSRWYEYQKLKKVTFRPHPSPVLILRKKILNSTEPHPAVYLPRLDEFIKLVEMTGP